jgi:hypothetical protein
MSRNFFWQRGRDVIVSKTTTNDNKLAGSCSNGKDLGDWERWSLNHTIGVNRTNCYSFKTATNCNELERKFSQDKGLSNGKANRLNRIILQPV